MTPSIDAAAILAILLGVPLVAAAATLTLAAMPPGGRTVAYSVLAVLTVCIAPLGL